MSKFIVVTLSIFLLFDHMSFSMEKSNETSYLLSGRRKRSISTSSSAENNAVVSLTTLAPELKELIFSFLPGNDRGLNYLARWIDFYPSDETAEKIEVAFLQYLIDHAKHDELERVGHCMVHFFEHVEYKKKHNKLNMLYEDLQGLDQSIPNPDATSALCCIAWSANPDALDEEEIQNALIPFCEKTLVAWQALSDSVKKSITIDDFIKIRKTALDYFIQRLDSYIHEDVLTCTLLPACACCACSGCTVLSGVLIAELANETAGVALGAGGGLACFFLGCMGMFLPGPWNSYNICELVNKDTELEQHQEKIRLLVKLVHKFRSQINNDLKTDEID